MRKYTILLTFFLLIGKSLAQVPALQGVKSPNVYDLGTFGSIPVSYFTGTPDISIPIYTLKSGKISLPITLNYHPANVKPNQHPGWVGLGWNLNCGGVITRVVHGVMDEYDLTTDVISYFPNGCDQLDVSNWNSQSNLKTYFFSNSSNIYTDCEADEFFFSFLGFSGKFIYTSNGWEVVSDQNIKVECINEYMKDDIQGDLTNQMDTHVIIGQSQSRQFKQFILTTEDGTRYYFGGNTAIEYSASYYSLSVNIPTTVRADAWYLTRIVDINNNEINLTYTRNNPICRISYYINQIVYECTNPSFTWPWPWKWDIYQGWSGGTIDTSRHSGYFILPVYLKEIVGNKEKITFTITSSLEKSYSSDYLQYSQTGNNVDPLIWLNYSNISDKVAQFKWYQLDSIKVKDLDGINKHQYKFSYSNNINQRLTLNSLKEIGNSESDLKLYSFEYNNVTGLPSYGGDYTDHWGFFNARTIVNGQNFSNIKKPDSSVIKTGLLKTIHYPTGGHTDFFWEANNFSKVVANPRNSLQDSIGLAGGVRIKEIRNYDDYSDQPLVKKYYYVTNFNTSGTASSGILNGKPCYTFDINNRLSTNSNEYFSYNLKTVNDLTTYSYNANGSSIGYSEVVEQNGDSSYTRYLYSNYGTDIHNAVHFDIPETTIGWKDDEDRYIPQSSLENERGKIQAIEVYNSSNIIVDKTDFEYYNCDYLRSTKYIKRVEKRNSMMCAGNYNDVLILGAAFKDFTYRYNLLCKTQTSYDINGLNPIVTKTINTYNVLDQLVAESMIRGNKTITNYTTYPCDYNTGTTFIDDLKTNYIFGAPIETVTVKNDSLINNRVINGQVRSYLSGGNGLIEKIYKLELTNGNPIPLQSFKFSNRTSPGELPLYGFFSSYNKDNSYKEQITYNDYDSKGNPLIVTPVNNIPITYIYGFHSDLIVAQVLNDSTSTSAFSSFENNYDNGSWTYNNPTCFSIQAKTGKGCYSLQSGQISKSLPIGVYKLQFWAKSPVTVTGGTVKDIFSSTADPNGWILYLKEVTIGASPTTITLSGSAYVDELRLFPSNAKMTSYTYDPVYGLTSECDENCILKMFDYDSLGRLIRIKDQNGNVLKEYKYNYVNN